MNTKPLFETHALATLERAKKTFTNRGDEYGNTWLETRFLATQAVARQLGYDIKPEHFRALASAALVDLKYWRNLGGYKDDSLIDGINYQAFLAEEMNTLGGKPKQAVEPEWPKYWARRAHDTDITAFKADNAECTGFYWKHEKGWVQIVTYQPFHKYAMRFPDWYSPITAAQAKELGAQVD